MNKDQMMMVALLFSAAIGSRPEAYPADWVNEHDDLPDLCLGTGNNWWLRINETGGLYIQSRSHALDNDYIVTIADKMLDTAGVLMEKLAIKVQIPWPSREIQLAASAMRDKSHRLNENIREAARREEGWIREAWVILHREMGDCLEGLSLPQAIELLVSQRDNARNGHAAVKEELELLVGILERAAARTLLDKGGKPADEASLVEGK